MSVAVVGAGITGLAVTYELLRAGHDVRCFEVASPMAERSTGDTRIFRLAHTSAALVDWAAQARREWDRWSEAAGRPLVGVERAVVSGDIDDWASALAAAGAEHEVTDRSPGLPAESATGPFLVDPNGGVIQAAATGSFLREQVAAALVMEAVTAIESDDGSVRVVTPSGETTFDRAVILAGAGTARLASMVGIEVPSERVHHARFTYPLREPAAAPPCWIDRSGAWRDGFSSYQHLAGPGLWAIGGLLSDQDTSWDVGRDTVTEQSRQVVTQYVADHVTGAVPEPIDTVYCSHPPRLGDGLSTARTGSVIAAWGDNLFKFAPVIGTALTHAVTETTDLAELDALRPQG